MLNWIKRECLPRPTEAVRAVEHAAEQPLAQEPVDWRAVMREAVLELDADGRVVSLTLGRQSSLIALEGEEGRYLVDRMRASDRVVFLHAHARVRGGEGRVEIDVTLRLDEAGRDWIDVSLAIVAGSNGAVVLLSERDVVDVPEQVELTEPTQGEHDPLADLAHELRTPLNAVAGYAGAMRAELFGALNERQHDALRAIEEASEHVVELSNAVLDAARFGTSARIMPEHGPIEGTVERACRLVGNLAHRHGVTVANRVTASAGSLPNDAAAVRQIVLNLLTNAVKASPSGATVSIDAYRDDTNLELVVRDAGCGMSAAEIATLGTRFGRGRNTEHEATGGLGLPLVKRLVEAHNGSLRFTSKLGEGTTAKVTLPLRTELTPTVVPLQARLMAENANDANTASSERMMGSA